MDATEITLVVIAVLVGFFAKGATGIGGPMLAVPVLAGFMGAEYAAAVIAIPTFVANCWLMWKMRDGATGISWFMTPLLVAGAVGTLGGAWLLTSVDEDTISLVLAGLVIAYIVWYFVGPEEKLSDRWARRLAAPVGFSGGALVGATGIGAPVIASYVHALEMARSAFIFAVTLPFWVLGGAQMVAYGYLGVLDSERLIAGLIASIPALAVMPPASKVGEKLSHRRFQIIVLAILAAAALRLIWTALT
ncbi:MAG TPA: sulfite exporter TauE/SafE family protein [Acidimicrobiia bacterium]|nr:sulfite exporter TauE/SafE family protein [Acidimicrobiia bacterium]